MTFNPRDPDLLEIAHACINCRRVVEDHVPIPGSAHLKCLFAATVYCSVATAIQMVNANPSLLRELRVPRPDEPWEIER
jgi:hypothetical protein